MDSQIIQNLKHLIGAEKLLLVVEPEAFSVTTEHPITIKLASSTHIITIVIPTARDGILEVQSVLKAFLEDFKLIITWGVKDLLSYLVSKTGKHLVPDDHIWYDLKLIQWHTGSEQVKPTGLDQAFDQLRLLMGQGGESLLSSYRSLYWELISNVLPRMESFGVVDRSRPLIKKPYYDLFQKNGRLNTKIFNDKNYNPHSLHTDEKKCYYPSRVDNVFVYWDYKHFEVSVLQWLSKDAALGLALLEDKDCYEVIWKLVTNTECNDFFRNLSKRFFLPIIYGQGVNSLMSSLNVSELVAKKIHEGVNSKFSQSINWTRQQRLYAESNKSITDCFGRKRFINDEFYKAMNASIQMVAAYISQVKLVDLHKNLKKSGEIVHHVHDEYVACCPKGSERIVAEIGRKCLEDSSKFPGLTLKVSSGYGENLNDYKPLSEGIKNEIYS